MRADRLQTNTYPISHRPARAALCLLLGAGILALAVYLQLGRGGSLPFSLGSPATAVPSRATPSPKRAEGEITLAAHTWYALQLGAFTQEGSARQLAQEASGPLLRLTPGATDNATSVSLCETPRFASTRVRLIPTAHMTVHVQQAIPSQDMSAMHKTKVDAAIVRIIKTAKFMGFKDLVAKLNAFLDFIPEEQFVKERVESLIAKDYLERDEKDPSILVYQPWCVCHKQQHLSKNTQKTANIWGYN